MITTSSVEFVHAPFEMVHLNVAEEPTTNPMIPELAEVALEIVAVPEVTVQVPFPADGVFPARVVEVTLQRF